MEKQGVTVLYIDKYSFSYISDTQCDATSFLERLYEQEMQMQPRELRAPQFGQRQETMDFSRNSAYWLPEGRLMRSLNVQLSHVEDCATLTGLTGVLTFCGLLGLGGSRRQSNRIEQLTLTAKLAFSSAAPSLSGGGSDEGGEDAIEGAEGGGVVPSAPICGDSTERGVSVLGVVRGVRSVSVAVSSISVSDERSNSCTDSQ